MKSTLLALAFKATPPKYSPAIQKALKALDELNGLDFIQKDIDGLKEKERLLSLIIDALETKLGTLNRGTN